MRKPLVRAASFILSIRAGDPYLVRDHNHHKKKIKAECPEDEEFEAFETPPGDGMFLGARELIVFQRRQH
jgi:hypothetical protein